MWAGDREFTSRFDIGIYSVLEWYNKRIGENGLLGPIDWWPYADWCVDLEFGEPPGAREGNSAFFSLHYAYTLKNAARIKQVLSRVLSDKELSQAGQQPDHFFGSCPYRQPYPAI